MQSETIRLTSGAVPKPKASTGHIDTLGGAVVRTMLNVRASDDGRFRERKDFFRMGMLTGVSEEEVSAIAEETIEQNVLWPQRAEVEGVPTVSAVRRAVVPVSHVTKIAGGTVFAICAFSLITSLLVGFHIVQPYFALAFAFASGGFYLMGRHLGRRER